MTDQAPNLKDAPSPDAVVSDGGSSSDGSSPHAYSQSAMMDRAPWHMKARRGSSNLNKIIRECVGTFIAVVFAVAFLQLVFWGKFGTINIDRIIELYEIFLNSNKIGYISVAVAAFYIAKIIIIPFLMGNGGNGYGKYR